MRAPPTEHPSPQTDAVPGPPSQRAARPTLWGPAQNTAQKPAAAVTAGPTDSETLDSELVVAVFRIAVLLVALLVPRIFGTSRASPLAELLLAGLAAVYVFIAALACLYPRRYGVRRPLLVAVDTLLITLWMRLSQQWELFSLYYVVVIVAAMWFRVIGGAVAAIFCNFFFLYLWGRMAGESPFVAPPPFLSAYALNLALLLLVGCLAGYIAEAQEHERLSRLEGQLLVANYQREIDLANQLQPLIMESGEKREWAALRLGVAQKSARSFGGGDFFDVLSLEDGRIALCIADVSGKSVRAQARLPLLKYSLRALAPLFAEPDALLTRLNHTLAPELENDLFIGLCLVVIDARDSSLVWVNAGHCAPLLLSGGNLRELETCGPALGPFPEIPYRARKLVFAAGDRLLLFTDGLTDALSFAGTEDGEEQVRAAAKALDDMAWKQPQDVAQRLLDMATAVLDETLSPWLARIPERITLEKMPRESTDTPGSVRRDDITVAAIALGVDTLSPESLGDDASQSQEAGLTGANRPAVQAKSSEA